MSGSFDTIVLGLGGMGSAVVSHLAARGQRVLGLDQFTPPHEKGSSHGASRVIRQAYYEDPAYVPLLMRAFELWRQLERDSGQSLLTVTGALMLGTPGSAVVSGSLRSAREHGLPHELLDAGEIRRRFPPFTPPPGTVALHERNAGFLRPEAAIHAHLDQATRHGARLQCEEKVLDWNASLARVRVTTTRGSYEAAQLVIAAGPWATSLLADLRLPLAIERQVQFWYAPPGGIAPFLPDRFPVWIWETEDGLHPYGLPALDGPAAGVKVALHHGGNRQSCTPDAIDRQVAEQEIAAMRRCLANRIPSLGDRCLNAVTCMYTNAPDGHFVMDRHPAHPEVLIVSPCSGHGFKFCPVIGEIVADLLARDLTAHQIQLFRFDRLRK